VAQGVEPLCDWLDAIGSASQARANGRPGSAELARRALAAIPAGAASARARLELALAQEAELPRGERAAALAEALRIAPPEARAAHSQLLAEASAEDPPPARADAAPATVPGDPSSPTPPDPPPVPSGAERLERAWRFLSLGQAADAAAELAQAGAPPPDADAGYRTLAGAFVAFAQGRVDDARRDAEPLSGSPDPSIRRGAQLVLARAASRDRRVDDAVAAWKAIAASAAPIPGLAPGALATLRDDAAYFAAVLRFDSGEFDRAASELERFARARPGSRRAEDARWFAAWALVRKGSNAEADAALRRLERGAAIPRVRYWRARVAGDAQAAASLLRSVVAAEPLGYYGLLACARLVELGEPCARPALGNGRPAAPAADPAALRPAAVLAGLGLRDAALAELAARISTNGGRRLAPAAAELAAFVGDPQLPFRAARDHLGLSRRTLAWSFPEPWPELVEPAASATGLDPALIRAIMRRESGFQSGIRSQAGAIGLLQVIPPTATRLGALLGLDADLPPRLGDPGTNVPLGAAYFALLLERFGHPIPALAAYNAGPGAVERWLRDRGDLPLDAWVESIPYRETRQYVRAVVENWEGARRASGRPPPALDLSPLRLPARPGVAF
jgi:soluble lytic murein transglycosylase